MKKIYAFVFLMGFFWSGTATAQSPQEVLALFKTEQDDKAIELIKDSLFLSRLYENEKTGELISVMELLMDELPLERLKVVLPLLKEKTGVPGPWIEKTITSPMAPDAFVEEFTTNLFIYILWKDDFKKAKLLANMVPQLISLQTLARAAPYNSSKLWNNLCKFNLTVDTPEYRTLELLWDYFPSSFTEGYSVQYFRETAFAKRVSIKGLTLNGILLTKNPESLTEPGYSFSTPSGGEEFTQAPAWPRVPTQGTISSFKEYKVKTVNPHQYIALNDYVYKKPSLCSTKLYGVNPSHGTKLNLDYTTARIVAETSTTEGRWFLINIRGGFFSEMISPSYFKEESEGQVAWVHISQLGSRVIQNYFFHLNWRKIVFAYALWHQKLPYEEFLREYRDVRSAQVQKYTLLGEGRWQVVVRLGIKDGTEKTYTVNFTENGERITDSHVLKVE